jgi:hypothetical protein
MIEAANGCCQPVAGRAEIDADNRDRQVGPFWPGDVGGKTDSPVQVPDCPA